MPPTQDYVVESNVDSIMDLEDVVCTTLVIMAIAKVLSSLLVDEVVQALLVILITTSLCRRRSAIEEVEHESHSTTRSSGTQPTLPSIGHSIVNLFDIIFIVQRKFLPLLKKTQASPAMNWNVLPGCNKDSNTAIKMKGTRLSSVV